MLSFMEKWFYCEGNLEGWVGGGDCDSFIIVFMVQNQILIYPFPS